MAILKAKLSHLNVIYLNKHNISSALESLFDKFDEAFLAAKFRCSFSAGGLSFSFHGSQQYYLPLIKNALNLDLHHSEDSAKILSANFGELSLPYLVWHDDQLDALGLEALLKDTSFRLHIDTKYLNYSIFDRERNCGIHLTRAPNYLPPWESSGPLRLFIHWHLANQRRAFIHAGSLGINNTGVLFAGPGGSGKSSTVISGILHGLQSVGDDYVSVEVNETIILRPIYQIVKINPERLSLMGVETTYPVNWQNKVELKFSEFPNLLNTTHIEARALCLPKVAYREKTRFIRTTSSQGFLTLTPSTLAQLPGDRDYLFRNSAEIARKLPCYIVELGTDPHEIAEAVESFVMELSE